MSPSRKEVGSKVANDKHFCFQEHVTEKQVKCSVAIVKQLPEKYVHKVYLLENEED
jgi:hypothetical protein